MGEDNIKDFTINWMVIGLLAFCMMAFSISFMYNNNDGGLGDSVDSKFTTTKSSLSNNLYAVENDSDTLLNITANTNPEAGDLGSRDSVASAYKQKESGVGMYESLKTLMAWVFVGEVGKMLIALFSGIIGFTSVYFIVKWIRNGI